MIKEWVVFNKLEDFNSLLEYTDDDFTPSGKFCYINENGEKLYRKLMKEFYNLKWYIQHLVDRHEYQNGDNELTILYMKAIGPTEQTSISWNM